MFSSTPSTNAPTQYKTNANYATTFTGPVYANQRALIGARNQSMSQAAYAGDTRQFSGQRGQGVRAGSNMQGYRAAMTGTAQAAKGYAQAQQDLFSRMANNASARLDFQERLAGERGWNRDLLLDENDTQNRERLASYKRFGDINLAAQERYTNEGIAAEHRKTTILKALLGG